MMSEEVVMKMHFLIFKAEVLYIDKKDIRDILLLKLIKRIWDHIDLSILF
jgi:hypothetical protein